MHVTRSMSLSRFLISIAALALLAGLLLLPDQAHAQTAPTIAEGGDVITVPEGTTTSTVLHTYTATNTGHVDHVHVDAGRRRRGQSSPTYILRCRPTLQRGRGTTPTS